MKPNLKPFVKKLKKAAPYILSGLSVVGVVATAVLSAKNTVKALEQAEERDDTWKCYIPTALTVIATSAVIIGNGVLNHKQQASLISAYTIMAGTYKRYREKTRELYGPEADKRVISEIATDNAKPKLELAPVRPYPRDITVDWGCDDEETKHLFYETQSQRYFESTCANVYRAESMMNERLSDGVFVTLNDFYKFLGIDEIAGGDEIGWALCDHYAFITFDHYQADAETIEAEINPDNQKVLVIDYYWLPQTVEQIDDIWPT